MTTALASAELAVLVSMDVEWQHHPTNPLRNCGFQRKAARYSDLIAATIPT